MKELNLRGTYLSYSIVELNQADTLFLQNIMEKDLITYNKLFFELKAWLQNFRRATNHFTSFWFHT